MATYNFVSVFRKIALTFASMSFPPKVKPGTVALSVTTSLGKQEAPRSILSSGTFFREDLVMKIFLRPFFLLLIQEEQLSVNGKKNVR